MAAALKTSFSGAILNDALTMGLNQGLQELLSQLLSKKFKGADFTRSLKYMFYGACVMTPANFYLAKLIDAMTNNLAKQYKLSARAKGDVKLALSTALGLPANAALFTAAILILLGMPTSSIPKAIKDNTWPVTKRFASLMLPAQIAVSRGVIPPWLAPIALQGLAVTAGLSIKVQLKEGTLVSRRQSRRQGDDAEKTD